ncbi:MAG: peptide chain release factor N(5)-glutamine methyltransferase [Deltaproteobacteria bacterium]|jgi:release factor glutamine methyltransferase|nr:peptide chain release factor N(5)-glutamine methyltransferase [Deltaproteobacteria bacterium]
MSEKTWSAGEILAVTTDFLAKKDPSAPRLEAELLLGRVLGLDRVGLYVSHERVLTEKEVADYRELVRRRASREPVAYILGKKEFYGLDLEITPAVLVPRPETEHLVDEALRLLKTLPGDRAPSVADVGCGSGAIALAVSKSAPGALVCATDASPDALGVARLNAERLGLAGRVEFFEGDLAAPLAGRTFDIICANLPYVPDRDMLTLPPDVAGFEPALALRGGPEGVDLIARLLPQARDLLRPGGHVLLEIWPASLPKVSELALACGLSPQEPVLDYALRDRVFAARA